MPLNSPRKRSIFPSGATRRAALLLGAILLLHPPRPLHARQANAAMLQRILLAEDRRVAGAGDLEELRRALGSRDVLVVRRAVRAIGRLEKAEFAPRLYPLLTHRSPAVRGEAALGMAQALQGLRAREPWPGDFVVRAAYTALENRIGEEHSPAVLGRLALAIARLPYRTDPERIRAERSVATLLQQSFPHGDVVALAARGAEFLYRTTPRRDRRNDPLVKALLTVVLRSDSGTGWPVARRRALGALIRSGNAPAPLLARAYASPDAELRRLAVSGLAETGPDDALLARALGDRAPIVRREGLRVRGLRPGREHCGAFAASLSDSDDGTRLLAIDLLGTACTDTAAARRTLAPLAEQPGEWRTRSHAAVALARLAPGARRPELEPLSQDSAWQARMYAARAAGHAQDTAVLNRLALDPHPNVREAALAALRPVHAASAHRLALQALDSEDYQLVLTAATVLNGADDRAIAAEGLIAALDRITRENRETSRDTRIALLKRIGEVADPFYAERLTPWLRDFDPVVAESAAALLTVWNGRPTRARPGRREQPTTPSLAAVEGLRRARLRLYMASGDTIDAQLLVDEAPLTVFRVVELVRKGYYDGLTFHRVVPNFVAQGGSPGANEYAGDGPFMRDELGPVSHERGTFGISTRGRDTGDAQLFINLVDNPRLDFEYTVWARVVRGLAALDRIGEGDVIRKVEVRAR